MLGPDWPSLIKSFFSAGYNLFYVGACRSLTLARDMLYNTQHQHRPVKPRRPSNEQESSDEVLRSKSYPFHAGREGSALTALHQRFVPGCSRGIEGAYRDHRTRSEASAMKTYITVNRGVIDSNRKRGTNQPPIRVSHGRYGKVRYAHSAQIRGFATFRYDANNPLPHGARLWVETDAPVKTTIRVIRAARSARSARRK